MAEVVRAAWRYRDFVISAVINDLRSRYARSKFGMLWVVLQPLAQVIIFSTVLSSVLAARLEGIDNKYAYAAYLLTGIVCWSLFAETVQRLLTVFIDNAAMLKKVSFPRSTLPLIAIGSVLVSHIALLTILILALPLLGFMPTLQWLWLIPLGLITVLFATALGLILGIFNVFVRDVGQVTGVVLQLWFWVTPIVYPATIIPESVAVWMHLNPMFPLIKSYHDIVIFNQSVSINLWVIALMAIGLLGMAWLTFRRASAELVDAL